MRILKLKKKEGCDVEVVVFTDGLTIAKWCTKTPSIVQYNTYKDFEERHVKSGDTLTAIAELTPPSPYFQGMDW